MGLATLTKSTETNGAEVATATETLTNVVDAGVNTEVLGATYGGVAHYPNKVFLFKNGGDVSAQFQIVVARTAAFAAGETVNLGSAVTVAAGATGATTLTDPYNFLRINVNPSGASTGSIEIEVRCQRT